MSGSSRPSAATCDAACAKAFWRIVPVLFVSYVLCSMDRYNVAFAQMQLRMERHITDAIYGLGATLYFATYVACAVPANMLLHRWGAKRMFFLIMLGWGACSASMFMLRTPYEFYAGRLLLGAFEAGFYPGVIYYLGTWFPQTHRSHAFAVFTSGVTVAGVVVGPLSGWIMTRFHMVGGLAGWQWLFLLEGLPSCLMAVICFFVLKQGPSEASWLSLHERQALEEALAQDRLTAPRQIMPAGRFGMLRSRQVYLFALVYFCSISGVYALGFWVPAMIRSFGATTPLEIGLYSVIPWGLAAIGTVMISRRSDRMKERRWHAAGALLVGAAALGLSTLPHLGFSIALSLLSIGAVGVIGAIPVFWAIPTSMMPPQLAASAVGLINCLGVSSGMIAPLLIGLLKERTGSLSPGLWCLVAMLVSGAALLLFVTRPARISPNAILPAIADLMPARSAHSSTDEQR
ncbi:MFS transporter [Burkholderia multivorans]|uniref:MFS transporter n=1 Tax=Burkholderia multivorans TaxID=87883 RepID=UPI0005807AC7|nr:MFS transporter [Burkholderia multivorans]KHS15890.1 transporter [Burkholderia multivorans]KHS19487.1 transporter [Burkholderia multivorans]MBR7920811.1 MFS transporter [Burkholderia multivorans]MBR8105527.1 MFS transporter [Burkholderia multivorans]MBR8341022.1 MFS transporter [Burkholderia multivorans]